MSIADLKVRISANADQFDSAMKKMQKSFNRSVRKMERTGRKMTRNITMPIAAIAGAAVTASVDFESAFTGVRKTVDATESEFQALRKGILDMSKEMPTTASEISGVAEAAGQLGIKTDAILGFSKTMVMLGDTTDMAAQEAATSLARIANIMEVPQDQFDEMGSVIVDLGNNFATTESEITEFAQRISGAANIAGMATPDVFALGAAFSSVGVEAGLGGTAVQKVLIGINTAVAEGNKNLSKFAEVAGMSAEKFQTLWRKDAGDAFTAFVNGLGEQGDQAAGTLEELGLADQRLMRAFLSLANAGDLLNRTLDTGRKAMRENNALTKEAQKRYDTLMSRLKMLGNKFVALGVAIGDAMRPAIKKAINFVENLITAFENLSSEAKARIMIIAGLLAAGGPLILAITKTITAIQTLATVANAKLAIIVGAFLLAVTVTQNLYDNWEVITRGLQKLWDTLKLAAWKLADMLIKSFVTMADSILYVVQEVAAAVQPSLVPAVVGARKAMEGLRDAAKDNIKKARDELVESTIAAGKADENFTGLGETFSNIIGNVSDFISETTGLNKLFEGLNRSLDDTNTKMFTLAQRMEALKKKRINQFGKGVQGANVNSPGTNIANVGIDSSVIKPVNATSKTLEEAAGTVKDKWQWALNSLTDIAVRFTDSFGQGMANVIVQGNKLVDTLRNIGNLLLSSAIQKGLSILLTGGLSGVTGFFGDGGGLFGSIFGGLFAEGGRPPVGKVSIVGERGPELFVPDRSGTIVPNSAISGNMGSRMSLSITTPVYLDSRKIYEGQQNYKNIVSR